MSASFVSGLVQIVAKFDLFSLSSSFWLVGDEKGKCSLTPFLWPAGEVFQPLLLTRLVPHCLWTVLGDSLQTLRATMTWISPHQPCSQLPENPRLLNDCNLSVGGSISQVLSHSPPTLPWAPLTGGETEFLRQWVICPRSQVAGLDCVQHLLPLWPSYPDIPTGAAALMSHKGLIKLFNQETAFFRGNSHGWIVVGRGYLQASISQKLGLWPVGNVTPPAPPNLCRAIKWQLNQLDTGPWMLLRTSCSLLKRGFLFVCLFLDFGLGTTPRDT